MNGEPRHWVHARRLQALAQNGLTYANNEYDRERYQEISKIAAELMASQSGAPMEAFQKLFSTQDGYATPKVDVRGAIFRDGKILLVKEAADGLWTLPGGWADVNDSPSYAVEREVLEESGFKARAVKLAAVYDRAKHLHEPAFAFHVYKLFFICELLGGSATTSHETLAVDFFEPDRLPQLSTSRVLPGQIELLFAHHQRPEQPTYFD